MPTSTRQDAPYFTGIFGEFATSQRAAVGIGPYIEKGKRLRIRPEFPKNLCLLLGPTESSAPTRRGTNSPKGFRVCSCLLQTPHNESDRQNRTGLPRVRQAGSVGVEKKEEREERKEKIGLLTSMSIPANHVRTVNESERICEHFLRFIPNYCTFFVAMISTPVPAAFESNTSPIFTGACAVT